MYQPSALGRSHPDHRAANRWGRSREPPVLTPFGGTNDEAKVARVTRCGPKRPARRSLMELQATGRSLAPLQAPVRSQPAWRHRTFNLKPRTYNLELRTV